MVVGQDIILIVRSCCVCCCYHYSTYAVFVAIEHYILLYETSDDSVFVSRQRKLFLQLVQMEENLFLHLTQIINQGV